MNENQNQEQEKVPPTLPGNQVVSNVTEPVFTHEKKVHEKKTWKEYFFEFILVFAAVVLGFTADSFRENMEDHQKEKNYMRSLISDINSDYTLSKELHEAVLQQVEKIDSLQIVLTSGSLQYDADTILRCYRLSSSILTFYPEFFHERTINQLLSSGSMRLIRDQDIADSIMAYHSFIKFLDVQRQLYINSISGCTQSMYDIYDIAFLRTSINKDRVLEYIKIDLSKLKLRTTNRDELNKFIAILENSKLVANNYMGMMIEMATRADRLYTFLSKVYD